MPTRIEDVPAHLIVDYDVHDPALASDVYARLDEGTYPDKIRVTDAEFNTVNIHPHEFHPEWNYIIKPHGH